MAHAFGVWLRFASRSRLPRIARRTGPIKPAPPTTPLRLGTTESGAQERFSPETAEKVAIYGCFLATLCGNGRHPLIALTNRFPCIGATVQPPSFWGGGPNVETPIAVRSRRVPSPRDPLSGRPRKAPPRPTIWARPCAPVPMMSGVGGGGRCCGSHRPPSPWSSGRLPLSTACPGSSTIFHAARPPPHFPGMRIATKNQLFL